MENYPTARPADSRKLTLEYARATSGGVATRPGDIAAYLLLAGLLVVVAGGLLSSLHRPRRPWPDKMCRDNLWSISMAVDAYTRAHGGAAPDSIASLYASGDLPDPRVLVCPLDGALREIPERSLGARVAAGEQLSYVYLAGELAPKPPRTAVVMFCPHHPRQYGVLLFADGHVEMRTDYRSVLHQLADGTTPVCLPPRECSEPCTTGTPYGN